MEVSRKIAGTFLATGALALNRARLEHLSSLGLDLDGKTVYEPGCGIGLLTSYFEDRECSILSSDVLEDNCRINLGLHPWREGRVIQRDIDEPAPCGDTFDIVFAYGLLYHVLKPEVAVQHLAAVCKHHLLVSTCVYYMDNGQLNPATQWAGTDQGKAGSIYHPSRDWVMNELGKYFPYVYVSVKQPNHDQFPTEWPTRKDYWKRTVFVASRNELDLPALSTTLLMKQEVYHGE